MRDFSIDLLWAKIQVAITAIGGWIGWFLGGVDGMLIALIVLMALDYVSGVMCAVEDKKLSSAIGFKGICKKVLILMLVGVANILDVNVVGSGAILRGAVICFYLSNEGLSLLENAAYLGLPVPAKLFFPSCMTGQRKKQTRMKKKIRMILLKQPLTNLNSEEAGRTGVRVNSLHPIFLIEGDGEHAGCKETVCVCRSLPGMALCQSGHQ